MWRKLLRYRSLAKQFLKVKVQSGQQTSFWYDDWSSLGRIHDLLGDIGFIDLGISSLATVSEALLSHRRRRYRSDILKQVTEEMTKWLPTTTSTDRDYALWKQSDGLFKPRFSSKQTWAQTRKGRGCDCGILAAL